MNKIYKTLEEVQIDYPKIEVGNSARDFSNLKFGLLTVLYRTRNNNKYRTNWICQCECGNYILKNNLQLLYQQEKQTQLSCGCLNKTLIGQKFGRLTVVSEIEKDKRTAGKRIWHCQCECGNYVDVNTTSLTQGMTSSCGCLWLERVKEANTINILNQRFGKLVVKQRLNNGKWLCQCDCGNTTETTTHKLKTGHTQSCGCLQKERASQASLIDLTGRRFGMLTVLYRDPQSVKRVYWYCKCDCGKIKRISGLELNRMDDPIRSCGCKTMSNGELKITQLLEEANIPYKTEYQFYDCINPKTNHKLRFDFYVNNKYLIEFDGRQHTIEQPDSKWKKETLEEIHYRDEIKNKYCKKNNIHLIRIPYTRYNQMCLEDLLLETTQFLYC